jgi:hypothetical protein
MVFKLIYTNYSAILLSKAMRAGELAAIAV